MRTPSLLRAPSGVVDLLEAAHALEPDPQRWTLRVLDGATRFFRPGQTVIASTFRVSAERVELLGHGQHNFVSDQSRIGELLNEVHLGDAGDRYAAPLGAALKGAFAGLDPRWVDVFYRHRLHLTFHSHLIKRLPADVFDVNRPLFDAGGFTDALAVQGMAQDMSLGLVLPLALKRQLLPRDRQVLLQVALHLESSMRAQLEPDALAAVIEPDGQVVHAEGPVAASSEFRSRLATNVLQVEQVRRPSRRDNLDSLDAWTALIQGRWALLERTDADGRRFYLAIDCERSGHPSRVLSATEVEIVQLAARGLAGKEISYALGLSGGTVSSALRCATLKLGCRSPAALVQLAARLLRVAPGSPTAVQLTDAEAGVLALVREGLTNAQIARRRSSSPNTVANQVATVLRKLGLPSRRAAAALTLT
jgi:DNA-binding CsgD family transcriptional regulator